MKTVKDLFLAMLNATLILVALCLFLLLQLSGTVERVTTGFAQNLVVLTPVADRIQNLSNEVAALRGEISSVGEDIDMQAKLSELGAKANQLEELLRDIRDTPERLMQTSIQTAAQSATDTLFELRGCQQPEG